MYVRKSQVVWDNRLSLSFSCKVNVLHLETIPIFVYLLFYNIVEVFVFLLTDTLLCPACKMSHFAEYDFFTRYCELKPPDFIVFLKY